VDDSSLNSAIEALRAEGYRVIEPPPPPPENHCATCGRSDDDNERAGFGPLVDVQVYVAYGEEGTAAPKRYFCYEHLEPVCDALIALGFGVHRHGGINFLEPQDCPGHRDFEACPTPVVEDEDGEERD
jgi:hypothetical protein